MILYIFCTFNSQQVLEPKTDETLTHVTAALPPINGNNTDTHLKEDDSTKQELYETRKENGLE